jgi:outer membrane receptor protein involved in Fe transport
VAAGRGPLAGHLEAHFVSERYQDLRNSPALRIPPALTFNAGAALRVARQPEARLALELRNVLDDRTIQDGFGNPLPGRTVMITLRVAGGKDAP